MNFILNSISGERFAAAQNQVGVEADSDVVPGKRLKTKDWS